MHTPILIVGAGPSGATLALHLALQGIKPLVISRHGGTANTPRAHIFNQRAMEVLRDAGLEERLSTVASEARHMQHTSWLHSLAGEEYARLWSWGNKPSAKGEYEAASPCVMSDLPQSHLEPVLVEAAQKLGVEFRWSTEFVSQEEVGGSEYLIGADGARSAVLDSLGIAVDGQQLNNAFNVHIKAELGKHFAHRPGSLNWILNPEAPDWSAVGNFRMVRPWNEFVVSMHPGAKDGKPFEPTDEDILKRLRQMIGDDSTEIELQSSYRWTINDQVARTWQKGRVLCIGDAAHRHPPINGLGSNTCISDAFNLAWKLAYMLKGWAGPQLLETVTTERKPVGDAIVRRANDGMEVHRRLWHLLGLTPDEREAALIVLKSPTNEGADLRRTLRDTIEEVDDEVQALGIQMNQCYCNSPATVVEADDAAPDFSTTNPLKHVLLSTYPGYHLPHVWLAANGQSPRISILDLAGHSHFTLFTGIGGQRWIDAARNFSSKGGPQLHAYSIGYGCDYMDIYRDWVNIRGVEEDGVVLVRPDQFIAWRFHGLGVENIETRLESVLATILGIRHPDVATGI